ncbi:MAG: hypothetical protein M1835_004615 [Candelina submexicana]|nr:MAG: hypothetical protein M1835_004615 [Candelina submexicana]
MDPGTAGALVAGEQVVSTTIQGGAVAGFAVARPTMPITATFSRIPTTVSLPRASHSISIIKGRAYIFGGEIADNDLAGNEMHIVTLPSSGVEDADYRCLPALGSDVPAPRAGHTASVIEDSIYIFGGHSEKDKPALDEKGRVWIFSTSSNEWSYLDPSPSTPHPPSRSSHASASNEHPISHNGALEAKKEPPTYSVEKLESTLGTKTSRIGKTEPDTQPHGTLFIHGGVTSDSSLLADLWAFDIASHTWVPFPDPPSPARSGASLTYTQNRLYRFGGNDGSNPIGGQIDYLEVLIATFDDEGGKGEMALTPKTGTWETIDFPDNPLVPGPRPRSLAGLHPVTTGQGREFLLSFFGERESGKYWGDVWSFQLRPQGMTAASVKDATRQLFGASTGESEWAEAKVLATEEIEEKGKKTSLPGERGGFASAAAEDLDRGSIVLWGGISGEGERMGDGWMISVS